MGTHELKVARIGNSRGVRLPAGTLEKYRIGDTVIMEERTEGILLRPRGPAREKLSWADTAAAMAAESEDWGAFDATDADGLEYARWDEGRSGRVSEPRHAYGHGPNARAVGNRSRKVGPKGARKARPGK